LLRRFEPLPLVGTNSLLEDDVGAKAAKNCYAWTVQGEEGIASSWNECESRVSGRKGARFRGFATRQEARAWLDAGAQYAARGEKKARERVDLPEDAVFFDAGTGRGNGTEANVTDRDGTPLAHLEAPAQLLTQFGTIQLSPGRTNNFGELLGCYYALKIARRLGRTRVLGDSALVLDYWSKNHLSAEKRENDPDLVRLAALTARERIAFEADGGRLSHVPGGQNPADLGFHRD
jgi:ribonuclease HI